MLNGNRGARGPQRDRRLMLVADANRRLGARSSAARTRPRGRIWLNGRELGAGAGPRFAQLSGSHD